MLNKEKQKYFYDIVNNIKQCLNINVSITILNHNNLEIKFHGVYGVYWRKTNVITIDENFIDEQWKEFNQLKKERKIKFIPYQPEIENRYLKYVICHEIAHITYIGHSKEHEELSQKYLNEVIKSEHNKSR